jgi:hypothetical protein
MASTNLPPPGPPNLGNVITTADISRKGNGSYAADYVNWCRVGHLLREHAPGWQFHLRPTPEGHHVWAAPNGTGYVVGYFIGPDGQETPSFPQAVMDNRNAPVAMDRISARDVTDTHRRCLCTAAAAAFGLAWQLWAREPIEDPHREPAPAPRTLNTVDELAPAAQAAAFARGLTPKGLTALVVELSKGEATELTQLPRNILARLAKSGVSPETVARCNAAAEVEPADDADDLPATWAATA